MRDLMTWRRAAIVSLVAGVAGATVSLRAQTPVAIDTASFNAQGELLFPENTDRWITLGAGLGGTYEGAANAPTDGDRLSQVRMEPSAYDFFQANGHYADGTMMLLTFFRPIEKPEPALQGMAQGETALREIHLIDQRRFTAEGRAFFVYPSETTTAAPAIPVGSECVSCHVEHGAYDGTFTQFYPVMRNHPALAQDR